MGTSDQPRIELWNHAVRFKSPLFVLCSCILTSLLASHILFLRIWLSFSHKLIKKEISVLFFSFLKKKREREIVPTHPHMVGSVHNENKRRPPKIYFQCYNHLVYIFQQLISFCQSPLSYGGTTKFMPPK